MTPLAQSLLTRIAVEGPLSVADFMAECLLNPVHGYYATRDPLGVAGDFTTSPEISQMFGEMLGLCLAQTWLDQGAPERITLAEAGPGRGTLMADVLRATRGVPGFHDALSLHLVEASPVLRAAQAELLSWIAPTWHDRVDTLPQAPLFFVANEFFDALPIRQFLRKGTGWSERRITARDGALGFVLSPPAPVPALDHRLQDTEETGMVEICPALPTIVAEIGTRISDHGGAALIVDYGEWRSRGDTLQAVRAHRYEDPLASPGTADLTAHVDFEALAQTSPSAATAMTPQGVFLERLGITARAQAIARTLSGPALETHVAAHRRLTHPEEMGNLFKVIGFHPKGAPPPPGLDT